MAQLAGKTLKGYDLLEEIGSGGFGSVFRARQKSTFDREVAIKFIRPDHANEPEFIRRFETEAELVARLEHPHITPLIDYWRDPSGAYLVMRFLRGGSVQNGLENDAYSPEATLRILEQIASALDLAHRYDVIHRDIKPGNILLDEDGNAYLADFGIAKDLTRTHNNETSPDAIVGSLDYISPEQARGEEVTARTDIYSLGVTLYEMLLGKHPFDGLSSLQKFYKHINDPLPDLIGLDPEFNDELNDIIQSATRKDPAQRYSSVLEFALAFGDVMGQTQQAAQELNLIEQLTMREHEILGLIAEGRTNRQIAEELFIQPSTVKWHISQMYKKLGVQSRVQAIVRARELNLIFSGNSTEDAQLPNREASTSSLSIRPEPENPYKGLYAFQTNDARDFFGREKMVEQLIARMNDAGRFQRFLAIVGPSGSGKSSVTKAGLIPAIWKGELPDSERWFVVEMMPGNRPLDELEIALTRVAANQSHNMREHLERDEFGLVRAAELILPQDKTELVLVIDQFEELFTLLENEAHRQHFLNMLLATVNDNRSRVRIIVTMRADYYDRPLHYPEFGEMLRARMETVLPLTAKGLESAITSPANRVGITFEAGLVAEIISEMNYQAGALPLLQYALTELFEQREGRKLTLEAYHNIGGAVGALAKKADEIFVNFDEAQQELTRQIFLRLVTLGEGAEDTRRRTPFKELLSLSEEQDSIEEIIDIFANHRLLALDHDPGTRQPTVEVAHEAILREWELLRIWLNKSRDDIRQERIVAQSADAWEANNRDTSYLLRGSRLENIENWQKVTNLILTPLERKFIETSIEQHKTETRIEEERIARQKFLEKRELELIRQSLVRVRALVAVFVVAAILSVGFGLYANNQRNVAELARDDAIEAQAETVIALDIAQRSGLALTAGDALDDNEVDLAVALALESAGDDPFNMLSETRRVLERVENQGGPIFRGVNVNYCGWGSSRYGRYFFKFACDGDDYSFAMWDTTILEEVVSVNHNEEMRFGGFSGNFSRMLTFNAPTGTSLNGVNVTIWNVETWTVLAQYRIEDPMFFNLLYSIDSNYFFTAEFSETLSNIDTGLFVVETLSLREAETGEIARQFNFDDTVVQSFDYSDDGTMGVVGGWSGFDGVGVDSYRAIIFDLETGDILQTFDRPHNANHPSNQQFSANVMFTDNDTKIIISGYPNYIINLETGMDIPQIAELDNGSIRHRPSQSFETMLVYNSELGFTELYDLTTGEVQIIASTNELTATALPYQIITLEPGRLEEFLVWDLTPRNSIIAQRILPSSITDVEYSPDGRYIATVGGAWGETAHLRSSTIIYDAETLEEVVHLNAVHEETGLQTNLPWGLQWSPDGSMLATATFDEGVILWDTNTWQEIRRLTGTQDYVMQIRFIDNGNSLLATSGNFFTSIEYEEAPQIVKWDIATGEEIRRYTLPADYLPHHGIVFFALHPDETMAYMTVNTEHQDGKLDGYLGYLLDLETGESSLVDSDIGAGAFTPDGSNLLKINVVGSEVIVHDYPSMDIIRIIPLFDDIFGGDISPDSRYLVTGAGALAFESAVSVYDLETGQMVRRYFGHRDQTFNPHVSFHSDGTRFVTSGFDRKLIVWDFDPTTTLDWVRENRLVRDFTCTEREQYRIEPLCEE